MRKTLGVNIKTMWIKADAMLQKTVWNFSHCDKKMKGGERMYLYRTKVYRVCIENAFLSYDIEKTMYDKNAN